MTNLIYQGKIIRQFWGKLIRQSTKKERRSIMNEYIINATRGGASL